MTKATIIGATTWGTTLGKLMAGQGISVSIWARTEARAKELSQEHQNRQLSKADSLSQLSFTNDVKQALHSTEMVIWAIPAQNLRQCVQQTKDYLTPSMILVNAAKGLEAATGKRMSEVLAEEITHGSQEQICVLSGPNLSQEINQGLPASSMIAAYNTKIAVIAQELLTSPNFFVFISDDVTGLELCGSLKNVIALGAGMTDGLGFGDNAKAALITLGWAEVVSLGAALGAKVSTFYGLAGLGDLIATSISTLSRNHHVGYELGKGHSLTEITASMSNVAEGIDTTLAVHRLATEIGLKMPIIDLIHRILFESLSQNEMSVQFKDRIKTVTVI